MKKNINIVSGLLKNVNDLCLTYRFQKSGNINQKTDIYSYGIVLFELITGRLAMIRGPEENTHIVAWVRPIIESGDIRNIIDQGYIDNLISILPGKLWR